MRPSEILAELLGQHANLREMIDELRILADRARAGAPLRDDLCAQLVRLGDVLRRHNLREEEILRGVIQGVDAWGPVRASIMAEEHIKEHEELYAAVVGVPFTPHEFAGAGVGMLLDLLLRHMDREERIFLGEEILRDDAVVSDQFGG